MKELFPLIIHSAYLLLTYWTASFLLPNSIILEIHRGFTTVDYFNREVDINHQCIIFISSQFNQELFSVFQTWIQTLSVVYQLIPSIDSVRYLGFHLESRPTWNDHAKIKRQELN